MPIPSYPPASFDDPNERQHRRQLALVVNNANRGKINCYVDVSLDPDPATTTEVIDERIHPDCVVLFDPLDALAAAEIYAGAMYVLAADREVGKLAITHTTNAGVRDFRMIILS